MCSPSRQHALLCAPVRGRLLWARDRLWPSKSPVSRVPALERGRAATAMRRREHTPASLLSCWCQADTVRQREREGERNNQPFFRLLLLDQIWSEVRLSTNHRGCVSWENISASCDQESVITSADKWNKDDKAKKCILYSRRRIEREMGATAFASAVLLNFGFILGKLSPSNQELSHRLKV